MKRVIPLRLCLVTLTGYGVVSAFFARSEPVYAMRLIGGWVATASLLLMLALAGLALADTVLSELDSRAWRFVRRRRWLVWSALAAGHAVQSTVACIYGFAPWTAGYYLILAAYCVDVAVLDIRYRYRDGNCALVDSGLMPLDSPRERHQWPA